MRMQKKLFIIPAALLLAGASGVGFVHASTSTSNTPTVTAPTKAESDTADVQQGDQTAPDVAGAAEKPDTAEANAPEKAGAAEATTPDTDTLQQGDQSGPDSAK